jgi:hypothetical protein
MRMKSTLIGSLAGVTGLIAAGAPVVPVAADGRRWDWLGWSLAAPIAVVNTAFSEGCPIETADGLSLMIASTRDGDGVLDIWAADRASVDVPWNEPRALEEPVNSDANDFCPMPFERSLMFVSERDGEAVCGGGDIYLSRQSPAGGWSEPMNLGCAPNGPNTSGPERSPSLVETPFGTYLFYSTNGGAGDHDIYVAKLDKDGNFGAGHVVASLSSEYDDFMPNVRARESGGYEVVFNSDRPTWGYGHANAFGGQDVYFAITWHPAARWGTPQNLGSDVNTAGAETRATLSGDGRRLNFGRDGDIFVSERR